MKEKRRAFQKEFNRGNRPRHLATLKPWYDPARIDMPNKFERARAHYSALATQISQIPTNPL